MNPQDYLRSRSGRVIRTRGGYWSFVPAPLPPEIRWTPRLLSSLSAASSAVGELGALAQLLSQTGRSIRPLILREANLSSAIDGKGVPFADLFLHQCSPGFRQAGEQETQIVLNYADALEELPLAWKGSAVRLEDLTQLHDRLNQAGHPQASIGKFRQTQNWLGPPGSTLATAAFIPLPAQSLARALGRLESFLERSTDLPPLVRLGLIHYQFEAIHPFETGNGRLGRFLNTALLTTWGILHAPLLHLSSRLLSDRQAYFDLLLRVSQRSAWDEWLDFFFKTVSSEAADIAGRLKSLDHLLAGYERKIQAARNTARLMNAIAYLLSNPIFTVRGLEVALEVNFAVAQRYVNRLAAEGIVSEITGQARNRVYKAGGVLEILEAP